uniref:Serum response factor-binding protein 1 n=1 Tax=Ciona savignyi TaxID=51511 RepID=H2Y5V5_CIOSA
MVLMRRNIKRAKIHVISKLVRRIKNLRNKKGNEGDRRKNATRADRLLEEIDLIKDMKCDDIFKRMLLVELADIGKVEELKDRALLRIAAVSFIKPKIIELKNQLQHFDVERSKKDRTTSVNVAQKLDKISMGALREEKQQTERRDEDVQKKLEERGVESLGTKDVVANSMSLNGGSDELVEHQSISLINPGVDNVLSQDRGNSPEPQGLCKADPRESPNVQDFSNSDTGSEPNNLDGSDPGESPGPQDLDDGSTEFVLPEFYRQQNALEEKRDALKMMMSSGDDITDVLENIGKDFLPCDVTEEEEGSEDDPFFMEETEGSIDQAEPNKLTTTKSVFLSSLSGRRGGKPPYTKPPVAHKKKNRLGQRARKKLHGREHSVQRGNPGKRKAAMRPSKTKVAKIAPKVGNTELTNLHPSWQASQAKKKQNSIQKFEGTRIRFDD